MNLDSPNLDVEFDGGTGKEGPEAKPAPEPAPHPVWGLRLWVVGLACFVGGFVAWIAGQIEPNAYGPSFALQWFAYGAGLSLLLLSMSSQVIRGQEVRPGCLAWIGLAIASALAVITTLRS